MNLKQDKTYCINKDCPFKECDKHLYRLKNIQREDKYVRVANFDSVCRDYLRYILDECLEL